MKGSKREKILCDQPSCIFCGGNTSATTLEHSPPQGMFDARVAPKGHDEYPACTGCNHGTSLHDSIFIFFVCSSIPEKSSNSRLDKIRKTIEKHYPNFLFEMTPSIRAARKRVRMLGIEKVEGLTYQEQNPLIISPLLVSAVLTVSEKLCKSIFYRETEKIFPGQASVAAQIIPNTEIDSEGNCIVFQGLVNLVGSSPAVMRNRKDLSGQFSYKMSISQNEEIIIIQATFHKCVSLLIVGCLRKEAMRALLDGLAAFQDETIRLELCRPL